MSDIPLFAAIIFVSFVLGYFLGIKTAPIANGTHELKMVEVKR